MATKRRHLSRNETLQLHDIMKPQIVLGDKINGVQYANYIDVHMTDADMARLASAKMGVEVTPVQVRNHRTETFGLARKPPEPPKKIEVSPGLGLSKKEEERLVFRLRLVEAKVMEMDQRIGRYDREVAQLRQEAQTASDRFDNVVKSYRQVMEKHNALLHHVKQLDTEWSSCRPAGYQPGLPEIVNDTRGAK